MSNTNKPARSGSVRISVRRAEVVQHIAEGRTLAVGCTGDGGYCVTVGPAPDVRWATYIAARFWRKEDAVAYMAAFDT